MSSQQALIRKCHNKILLWAGDMKDVVPFFFSYCGRCSFPAFRADSDVKSAPSQESISLPGVHTAVLIPLQQSVKVDAQRWRVCIAAGRLVRPSRRACSNVAVTDKFKGRDTRKVHLYEAVLADCLSVMMDSPSYHAHKITALHTMAVEAEGALTPQGPASLQNLSKRICFADRYASSMLNGIETMACVTRRKLQTPGTEEHKRQETPTINPNTTHSATHG